MVDRSVSGFPGLAKKKKVCSAKTKAGLLTWRREQKEDEKKIALTSLSQSLSLPLARNKEFKAAKVHTFLPNCRGHVQNTPWWQMMVQLLPAELKYSHPHGNVSPCRSRRQRSRWIKRRPLDSWWGGGVCDQFTGWHQCLVWGGKWNLSAASSVRKDGGQQTKTLLKGERQAASASL